MQNQALKLWGSWSLMFVIVTTSSSFSPFSYLRVFFSLWGNSNNLRMFLDEKRMTSATESNARTAYKLTFPR